MSNSSNGLDENRIVTKVNSRGQKTRRVKCPHGYQLSPSGNTCVPIQGAEKAAKRMAIRKAVRTKAAKGAAFANRVKRKRLKALKKRHEYGLK